MGLSSFTAIREGLRTNLENIEGLRTASIVPDNINPPMAIVAPGPVTFLTFDTTFTRGSDDMIFVITLFVSRQWDRTSQNKLDSYLSGEGPQSVKVAVESDLTLGGAAMSVAVEQARNYGQFSYQNVEYYGCEFVVSVYA
jgi:hypothetical protein